MCANRRCCGRISPKLLFRSWSDPLKCSYKWIQNHLPLSPAASNIWGNPSCTITVDAGGHVSITGWLGSAAPSFRLVHTAAGEHKFESTERSLPHLPVWTAVQNQGQSRAAAWQTCTKWTTSGLYSSHEALRGFVEKRPADISHKIHLVLQPGKEWPRSNFNFSHNSWVFPHVMAISLLSFTTFFFFVCPTCVCVFIVSSRTRFDHTILTGTKSIIMISW